MRALDFALNRILPEDLRSDSYDMSKKGVAAMMASLARSHPDQYREVSKRLGDLGRKNAFLQGFTIGPADTQPVIDTSTYYARMDVEMAALRAQQLPADDFDTARNEILQRYSDLIEKDTMGAALKSNNSFARSVASGARGNPAHVKAILSTPGIYADAQGNIIPLFVRNSFASGVRPAETLAGTYGGRAAVISTKVATAKGGDYCLAAGTLVRMADYTVRAIETLRPGEWVLGSDKLGNTFPVRVVRVFNQGVKTVADYKFTDGRKKSHFVETCTAEHKFLVDYLRRTDVKVLPIGKAKGNRYGYIRPSGFDDSGLAGNPHALLLGLMLGDGCLPGAEAKSRVAFTCFDDTLISDTDAYMASLGLAWARRRTLPQQFRVSKAAGSTTYRGFRSQLLAWGVAGHRSHTKVVPEVVRQWDNESVADLLRGYFATDGCVTDRSVNRHGEQRHYYAFTSVSRELLCGIRDLMQWRFGVKGAQVTKVSDAGKRVVCGRLCQTREAFVWHVASASDVATMDRIMRSAPGAKGRSAAIAAATAYTPVRKLQDIATCHRNPTGEREMPCWDIEVDHQDHLFVLASNLICSNSKILNQSTSHYNVTEKDCGVRNGLDFEPGDASLRGRVLARDIAGLKAGDVIDKHALAAIRKQDQPVIARSPMTCKSAHGLCAHCAGLQADGNFPRVGDSLGITAGQSVGEPIVQSGLNAKHNCLEEGSMVRMADYSLRRIQDIRPGDYVLGADISGNTFPVAVKALWDQGLQPVNEYVYRLAPSKQTLSVRCTADHLILQTTHYSGAKEAEFNHTPRKIPAGRGPGRPAVVMPRDHQPAANLVSEPLASVVGYFLGDGIRLYEDSGSVRVSCACSQTVSDLREILGKFDMRIEKAKRSHDWFIAGDGNIGRERGPNGQFLEGDYRSHLRRLLGDLGFDGCYAHDKQLPAAVWGWDQESVARLVAGFVAADGSVYRNKSRAPGVSFSSTARAMLASIKEIMEVRFGVYSTALTRTGKAGKGNRKHDLWAFTVTRRDQVSRFNQAFGRHVVGGKGRKLATFLGEAPTTSVFANLPYMEGRRVTVAPIGERQCWDISVDHPDELFVMANGVIVKNSGAAKGKKSFSGFDVVSQFAQIPDEFKDKATVAERDGVVTAIREAPQGGHYVSVDNVSHFVLPGFELMVKPGDAVEAGDQLADGLINPSDIVRLRGLGEGRRYYADRLEKILQDSGQPPDRRNIELIARATVDHLRVDDADEGSDFLPDDLVREAEYMQSYKQPEDTADTPLHKATGLYLQQPVLHFTVGTRITPKIAERMRKVGATNVFASPTAPPFTPDMQRLRTASHSDKDWMASLSTSYLGKQMTQSAERGDETDLESNYHYAPRLAYGVGFGEDIERTGKF